MMSSDPDERSAMAAEYVIGTLTADELREFEDALSRDVELQRELYFWQDALLPMTRMLKPVEPASSLWVRIERSVTPRREPTSRNPRPNWWQGLTFWRGSAFAAALIAAVLAAQLFGPVDAPGPQPARYFAVLQSPDDNRPGWIVEAAAGGKLKLIPLSTTVVAPQKALQFWTKPQGAGAPTSLGLVRPDHVTEMDVARLPALEPEQLFELTLEPETGSPIGRPTGPILFVGRAALAMPGGGQATPN
jgi:anti-sigma-K factor RskA